MISAGAASRLPKADSIVVDHEAVVKSIEYTLCKLANEDLGACTFCFCPLEILALDDSSANPGGWPSLPSRTNALILLPYFTAVMGIWRANKAALPHFLAQVQVLQTCKFYNLLGENATL